ncbi:hypothetical protein FACS1894172_02410 [Spirochaetia bacterium]|nr:hypothetical protein FACS1894164_20990 [Spirochaetia bacterium]GHU30033.1 hypothetical protein FACS1894172_02410 [Spirochaetia bacterium]
MAHSQDYIPTRDADFDGWFENLRKYVTEKSSGQNSMWIHIPQEKITAFAELYTTWHTAYGKTIAPHTSVDTEAKNRARKAAIVFIRPFVAQFLKFDPVTNEDRMSMRIHNRDTIHSTIGIPTTRPVISDIRPLGGFQVVLRFQDEATPARKAVPYGYNGCLLNFTWGAERVTDYAALTQTQLMTRSIWTLSLPPEAEKTYLSCAPRWQNEKGELGPWGEIKTVVIA